MGIYIALVGDKYWDTINGVWAFVKQNYFTPEVVYLIGRRENRIEEIKDDISTLLKHSELEVKLNSLIIEGKPGKKVENLIEDYEEIALDISGASKSFAAQLLVHPITENLDHVYCLESSEKNIDRPYPILDRKNTFLKDLKRGKR